MPKELDFFDDLSTTDEKPDLDSEKGYRKLLFGFKNINNDKLTNTLEKQWQNKQWQSYITAKRLNAAEQRKTIDLNKSLETLSEKIDGLETRIEKINTQFIEILGIFAAMLAFISIEFRMLGSADSRGAVSLSLILAGIIFSLILAIHFLIGLRIKWFQTGFLLGAAVVLVTVGVMIGY